MYKNIDVDYLLRDAEKAIEKQNRLRALQAIEKQNRLRTLQVQEQQIRLSWGKPIYPVSQETRRRLLSLAVQKRGG